MAGSHDTSHPRKMIRIAPWICSVAIGATALTCIWVRAPLNYLLWSVGFGIVWFALLALTWRTRNGAVYMFTLLFVGFSHQILRKRLMYGEFLGVIQGFLVSIAFLSVMLMLLRRWLYKFARLETDDHAV